MQFTNEYWREEWQHFWQMCGDRNRTVKELVGARRGLFWLYLNCEGDHEKMSVELQTADMNYLMRLPFFEKKDGYTADDL